MTMCIAKGTYGFRKKRAFSIKMSHICIRGPDFLDTYPFPAPIVFIRHGMSTSWKASLIHECLFSNMSQSDHYNFVFY